jgi:hypothetical protein
MASARAAASFRSHSVSELDICSIGGPKGLRKSDALRRISAGDTTVPSDPRIDICARTKVLNNELEDVFRRWYPQFRTESEKDGEDQCGPATLPLHLFFLRTGGIELIQLQALT